MNRNNAPKPLTNAAEAWYLSNIIALRVGARRTDPDLDGNPSDSDKIGVLVFDNPGQARIALTLLDGYIKKARGEQKLAGVKIPKELGTLDGHFLPPIQWKQDFQCASVLAAKKDKERRAVYIDESNECKFALCIRWHKDGAVSWQISKHHTCNLTEDRAPMSSDMINMINILLLSGNTPDNVLKKVRERYLPQNPTTQQDFDEISRSRSSKLDVETIRRIAKRSGLSRVSRNPDDALAVENIVTEDRQAGRTVLYKGSGWHVSQGHQLVLPMDQHLLQHLPAEYFVFARISQWQKRLVEKYGEILYCDATHNVSKFSGLKCFAIMITATGQTPKGYPILLGISNHEDHLVWSSMFGLLFREVPQLASRLKALVSDLAGAAYNGLCNALESASQPNAVKWLYCNFHLLQAWKRALPTKFSRHASATRNLSDPSWEELKQKMYGMIMGLIPRAPTLNEIKRGIQSIVVSKEELERRRAAVLAFLGNHGQITAKDYLVNHYFSDDLITRWAPYIRKEIAMDLGGDSEMQLRRLRTNNFCEATFKVLKYKFLQGKAHYRLETSIDFLQELENVRFYAAIKCGHLASNEGTSQSDTGQLIEVGAEIEDGERRIAEDEDAVGRFVEEEDTLNDLEEEAAGSDIDDAASNALPLTVLEERHRLLNQYIREAAGAIRHMRDQITETLNVLPQLEAMVNSQNPSPEFESNILEFLKTYVPNVRSITDSSKGLCINMFHESTSRNLSFGTVSTSRARIRTQRDGKPSSPREQGSSYDPAPISSSEAASQEEDEEEQAHTEPGSLNQFLRQSRQRPRGIHKLGNDEAEKLLNHLVQSSTDLNDDSVSSNSKQAEANGSRKRHRAEVEIDPEWKPLYNSLVYRDIKELRSSASRLGITLPSKDRTDIVMTLLNHLKLLIAASGPCELGTLPFDPKTHRVIHVGYIQEDFTDPGGETLVHDRVVLILDTTSVARSAPAHVMYKVNTEWKRFELPKSIIRHAVEISKDW